MTWQTASYQWPDSLQVIQSQSEAILNQVAGKMDESASRVKTLASKVELARHPLSSEAESLLHLRIELESLMCQGQILCVHPYQYQVGNQVESGHHLSPDTAIETLRAKLLDVNDKHKPTGQLYALGWMIAENSLANFAQAIKALFDVVNIPELGMVARRTSKEQSLQTDKFTKPNTIVQPRFKPTAHINQKPIRNALNWQGSQLAQLESLAADKNTPAQKLAALAQKRTQQLEEWTASLNQLKQSNVRVLKFEAQGTTEVIATMLKESQAPSHANSYTFSALFFKRRAINLFNGVIRMTQLALDAEIIPLKSPRINLSLELKAEDMSGQTSGTDASEQGDKGMVLSVSGLIPFKESKTLKRLMVLSRQKEQGKRKIYRIGNELAKSMTIRQVRFMGRVTADEQENLMAWKVSFQLREHLSVSEVKEQRENEKEKQVQTDSTENTAAVEPKAHAAISNTTEQSQPTRFEDALLQKERQLA